MRGSPAEKRKGPSGEVRRKIRKSVTVRRTDKMIRNPIFPGFNPDPCVCRKGGDYYVAVSTFEWMPGIPVYHSKDLKNWELLTHILTDDEKTDLKKLPDRKSVV